VTASMPYLPIGLFRHARLMVVETGERMFLWCEGGPSMARATAYPPPCEIDVVGGTYVLVDDGPIEEWRYEFIGGGH
jgi:hypothetical protein